MVQQNKELTRHWSDWSMKTKRLWDFTFVIPLPHHQIFRINGLRGIRRVRFLESMRCGLDSWNQSLTNKSSSKSGSAVFKDLVAEPSLRCPSEACRSMDKILLSPQPTLTMQRCAGEGKENRKIRREFCGREFLKRNALQALGHSTRNRSHSVALSVW